MVISTMKYEEYAVFWREIDNHSPNGWKQVGKPNRSLDLLREILQPEGTPNGVAWRDEDRDFKIMRRTTTVSEWHNEEAGTNSFRRYE